MNKALFLYYLKEYLVPAIRELVLHLHEVTNVVVQLDQAGGHGGGRANMTEVLHELNEFGGRESKQVKFITQCSRSQIISCSLKLILFLGHLISMLWI